MYTTDFSKLKRDLQTKVEGLKEYFSKRVVIVAYSGGVDSSVVAELAHRFAQRAIAVTADSPTVLPGEIQEAVKLARSRNWEHRVITINEIEEKNFRKNPPNRCYYCKKFLSKELHEIASEVGADIIVEGTNFTEVKGHRPGLRALKENQIFSPLLENSLTKTETRELAHFLGLANADKPSLACLSSRFPYGVEITLEKLQRVGKAERYIIDNYNIRTIRVRDHEGLARIEVAPEERIKLLEPKIFDDLHETLKSFGFSYVAVDCLGYRTGALNES
ncbi:MAG: ATP-dependent sacrificial sulfur transferase LarE [Candidatus Heimdallarchaeota archaeon]|nr:MAG: ATP-dependent sacrificial sulfur transferase LarE [Candidatus Heimdallarchaeota archaeon]